MMKPHEITQISDMTNPDDEIFIVRNGVKSAVTDRQGRNLRPIYDQIREHVQKNRTSESGSPIFYIACLVLLIILSFHSITFWIAFFS